MDVNFYGQADMAHTILKEWLAPDAPVEETPKHLIFTTSVLALFTIVGYGPYSPSKWAVRGLADTLSQEVLLYPQKVKVHVVYPGTILSPGFEIETQTKPEITKILESSDPQFTPEEMAPNIVSRLERGHYYVTVAFLGHLMKWGTMGGAFRNSWLIDTIMAWFTSIVWIFVLPDILGKIKKYGKEHGHPSKWVKIKGVGPQ
jgi:3-dehydrosphinganine reductase